MDMGFFFLHGVGQFFIYEYTVVGFLGSGADPPFHVSTHYIDATRLAPSTTGTARAEAAARVAWTTDDASKTWSARAICHH